MKRLASATLHRSLHYLLPSTCAVIAFVFLTRLPGEVNFRHLPILAKLLEITPKVSHFARRSKTSQVRNRFLTISAILIQIYMSGGRRAVERRQM